MVVEPGDRLSDAQRERVADLRGLLAVHDIGCAERAVEAILAEPDRHVARALAEGMRVEEGRLVLATRALGGVPIEARARAAFAIASVAGVLEATEALHFGAWQGDRALPSTNAIVPEGSALPKLRRLTLRGRARVSARELGSFAALEELTLDACEEVDLTELPSRVRVLHLERCRSIVAPAAPLARLEVLELVDADLSLLAVARAVGALAVENPTSAQLDAIGALSALERVQLTCVQQQSLGARPWPASVRDAEIEGEALVDVDALRGALALETLTLSAMALARLPELPNLGELDASGCVRLEDVSALASCRFLHGLDLEGCAAFRRVDQLLALRNLEHLDLRGTALDDARPLASLGSLRSLLLPASAAAHVADLRAALPRCDVRA